MVPSSDRMPHSDPPSFRAAHGTAIVAVLVAAALKWSVGLTGPYAASLLTAVVVAVAAAAAGFQVGCVAALTAVLIARILDVTPFAPSMMLLLELIAVAGLTSTLAFAVDDDGRLFEEKDRRIRALQDAVRRLQAINVAAERLEAASRDYGFVLLDCEGRIAGWRPAAARLFGRDSAIVGEPAAQLLGDAAAPALAEAMRAARAGGSGRVEATVRSGDGRIFDAEVEIQPLTGNRFDGFVMLVHDRTREQEWDAFAASSADAQEALREEADVAHRQLATLQHVTDPSLNSLPASQATAALLERLRVAIDADGVALIRVGPFRRRIVSLAETLAAEGGADRRQNDARTPQDRVLVVHNDPARVAAMSLVNWPDTVSSLIAVPVLSGGTVEGAIEVVDLRSRRSSEWEIALVQVVAARVAGRLQDESYLDAGAVA
jgi:PAS domain-containing protein